MSSNKVDVRRRLRAETVFGTNEWAKLKNSNPEMAERIGGIVQFKDILELIHKEAALEMQRNPYGIIFPDNYAVMFINNKGVSDKPFIDYKKSKELGKTVYGTDWVTEFNRMKIMFLNKTLPTNITNTQFYALITKKSFRKECQEYFKKHFNKCLQYKAKGYDKPEQ